MPVDPIDKFIGLEPTPGYVLTRRLGAGKIGTVYLAERTGLVHKLACKVIKEGGLKQGWERELEKVLQLGGVDNVVQYHSHASAFDRDHRPYSYVMFEYIDGNNLNDFQAKHSEEVNLAFIEMLLLTILNVLFACKSQNIFHGDLHAGNILIANPDPRVRNSRRKVFVSDFGYGGSHNAIAPKDDFQELANILSDLLRRLRQEELNARDRTMQEKLLLFTSKRLRDASRTKHSDPDALLREYEELRQAAERESAAGAPDDAPKTPADYLWAEAMGYRRKEWKDLFVPEFLAANDLLAKNNTILTGARGCGKTMSFRRLTKLMDIIVEEPSGVIGADQFVGFYLNCRDLVDAFPWLPKKLDSGGEQQLIHFFHLAWLTEACKTLARVDLDGNENYEWLETFMASDFGSRYSAATAGSPILPHVRSFLEREKEACRMTQINSVEGANNWPLAKFDFLDRLQNQFEKHVAWVGSLPLYLFLDDYTIPIVLPKLQVVLNPIIFKRRSQIFFKVSTESANSFLPIGTNEKPLEVHHDFALLDLATESLHQKEDEKVKLLEKIFIPRIDRYHPFSGRNLRLTDVLGTTPYSNNQLAWHLRNPKTHPLPSGLKRLLYCGIDVFVGMWSSDIRIMVEMFADMLRETNGTLTPKQPNIPHEVQDRCFRFQGSEFLTFAQSVRDPDLMRGGSQERLRGEEYGNHLKNIVEAFVNVARFELNSSDPIDNQGALNPKQAFRLEILDSFKVAQKLRRYHEGLVRYHVFLQDWRGKSQRGMLTPRLYLNRILLPYVNLTFSSHDHIRLTNAQFNLLLEKPTEFLSYWKKHRSRKGGQSAELPMNYE
jgi:serine/threonine protein kinase